ncbi:hypothetical protein F4802DRAFT_595481 [Xylaria palmicola]|nr:hypothetical protein F4802DRAFT_595481 [Xylaria palmicola]
MPRRGYTRPPMGRTTPEEGSSSAIPASFGKRRNGNGSGNRKTTIFDNRMQETPTQLAPFTPARSFHDPSAPTSTRKISASFSTDCPLSGHPTIAYSAITASTIANHPGPLTSHPIHRSSMLSSSRSQRNVGAPVADRALKTSYTYSNLPMPATRDKASSFNPFLATARRYARASSSRNRENIPPSAPITGFDTCNQSESQRLTPTLISRPTTPKKKTKPRDGISRSRTFNVLSNITASLSRTSLGQLTGNDPKCTSTSSKGTVRKDPALYINTQLSSSSSSQALLDPAVETPDPCKIYTAQPSAYWTGRFMALQDRFQSETLLPENLVTLVHAHAERSLIPVAQPSLASSATMGCITSTVKSNQKLTRPVTKSSSPGKTHVQPGRQQNPLSKTAPDISHPMATVNAARPSYEAAAALLVNEDARCRRIFTHLDALCATSEARISLQRWQQGYARRMGKESLLPEGGTMQARSRELTWVGRLLIGTGRGHSKKGGFGM